MEWNKLISTKRFGLENYHDPNKQDRTEFQRDYDRLIFSAPFRRMQNKTQVFPLPGNIFVHNRLTHSLEVASVGRSLASKIGTELTAKYGAESAAHFSELGSIASAACLAHDMGNPPFGHSGERAISSYFSEDDGAHLKKDLNLTDSQWNDLTNFEGNANAFRLLTHQFAGRRHGGFVMTYSTLASIVKYPYTSDYVAGQKKTKFGFFQAEKEDYKRIAEELGIKEISPYKYCRHPLVYLVEAADDICYEIMDIEDAHKLKLLSTEQVKDMLLGFFDEEKRQRRIERMAYVEDVNEQIAYLRSMVVGVLVDECAKVFLENEESILNGEFSGSLLDHASELVSSAYKSCQKISAKSIYRSQLVVDVEISGYTIIYTLIDKLVQAVFNPKKAYSQQLLFRVPEQYEVNAEEPYRKLMAIVDYVSGMTDVYALDLYQKVTGMSLPNL